MNQRKLLNIVLALSVSGIYNVPALGQVQPSTPPVQNLEITIPQFSAITITFPVAVTLDAGQKTSLTVAALLTRPLLDSNGNVVAAENSPVNIQLEPTKGGVQIKASALVVRGLVTPILANGPLIPEHKVITASNAQQAQAHQGFFSTMAGSVFGILFGVVGSATRASGAQVTNLTNLGNSLGTGLGLISGLSSPKTTRQVEIPQGSMYVLTLQAPVTLLPKGVQTALQTQITLPAPFAILTTPPAQSQGSATLNEPVVPTKKAKDPGSVTVVYVNPATGVDKAESSGNTEASPYRTITYALSQAQPNTVSQLAPGSYTDKSGEVFPLALKQGVTLRGDESTKGLTTLIAGGGFYISPTFARQNITIQAEKDSAIIGVSITNPNTRGTALWIESTNPTIKNSTFANSNREGIFVTGTAAPKIEANVFIKNGGNGISVTRSAQGEIRHNRFEDTGFGIALSDTSSPLVAENHIVQNTDGMLISDDARPILRNNVIENNKREGVVATVNAQPDLGTAESAGNNFIHSNGRYDVYNATGSKTLVAVGNDIDVKHTSGKVDFALHPKAAIASPEKK